MRAWGNGGNLLSTYEHEGGEATERRDVVTEAQGKGSPDRVAVKVEVGPFSDEFRQRLSGLIVVVFGREDPADLDWRLSRLPDVSVAVAYAGDGMVGFKLGYATTKNRYYTWLGGVHPGFRRQGIAARLMEAQHGWVRAAGFSIIETAAEPKNIAMLKLNLAFGFTIIGSYARSGQRVLLAKNLDAS
jgi:GNAT superfamily N-acetyltransferase